MSRFDFQHNFTLEQLLEAAERFGFRVDVRGQWPTMINEYRAAQCRCRRDMLEFISIEVK